MNSLGNIFLGAGLSFGLLQTCNSIYNLTITDKVCKGYVDCRVETSLYDRESGLERLFLNSESGRGAIVFLDGRNLVVPNDYMPGQLMEYVIASLIMAFGLKLSSDKK